ncbi:GNAT family N-acetyltransferase [Actinomyces haliotis]|uniref:GNAT family N-acetyltransferase n=1 Tax=Actinomyces haliotis TaxID=1280843 RepID=UPI00188FB719|nr:GNAT family N-acetyltransferase [Actinomyces haliotis]
MPYCLSAEVPASACSVTPAAPADASEAARVLAEAFQDDAPLRATLGLHGPVPPSRSAGLFACILEDGPLPSGTVDVARIDGRIVGVGVWICPTGTHVGLRGHARTLPRYVRALGLSGALRAARTDDVVAAHRPQRPSWYLKVLGVAPEHRGRGIGTALMRYRLAIIDAEDDDAYLESSTPESGRVYERLGFTPMRPVEAWEGARPWAMWRERVSHRGGQD